MFRKVSFNLLLILLYVSTFAQANIQDYCTAANVKYVSKNALMAYGIAWGVGFIHEFGHSLACKVLYGTPFDINIGGDEEMPVLAKLPGITLRGLNPLVGYAGWGGKPQYKLDRPVARMVHNQAGPIFGACASAGAWYLLSRYASGGEYELSICASIASLAQQIVGMLPFPGNTDGIESYKAYRQLRYGELE